MQEPTEASSFMAAEPFRAQNIFYCVTPAGL